MTRAEEFVLASNARKTLMPKHPHWPISCVTIFGQFARIGPFHPLLCSDNLFALAYRITRWLPPDTVGWACIIFS